MAKHTARSGKPDHAKTKSTFKKRNSAKKPPVAPVSPTVANAFRFPNALRVEPLAPFSERWHAKRRDYLDFAETRQRFADCLMQEQEFTLPHELFADWQASWAQDVFSGFFLPQHPTVPRERMVAAVRDVITFVEAYRFVFPHLAYADAHRFWAHTLAHNPQLSRIPSLKEIERNDYHLSSQPASVSECGFEVPLLGQLDQRQFLDCASRFHNPPSAANWKWLRRLAWSIDHRQPIWDDGIPIGRWGQTLRLSLPILSVSIGLSLDPRIVDPSTHFDVLVQSVENWSAEARKKVEVSGSDLDLPEKSDGPFDADGFRFAGVEVRFKRAAKQYGLVKSLWDSEKNRPGAPRPIQDVIDEVWGMNNETSDSAFRQLCSDTRRRFEAENFSLSIEQINGKIHLSQL